MRSGKLIALTHFFFALTLVHAQTTPTWTRFLPTGSAPRSGEGAQWMAYDSSTDRLIVFGGFDPFSPCCVESNDTWVLINATGTGGTPIWHQLTPIAPSGLPAVRHANSAVYDSVSNRMIIFGGGQFNGFHFVPLFDDVWVLTNANGLGGTPQWIPLTPSGGPPAPREGHGAFYKQTTNEMFVFGGGDNGIMNVPNDLWVLENANGLGGTPTWVQLSQAGAVPGPIEDFALAYDPASNRMTIAGGCCGYTNATRVLDFNDLSGVPTWSNLFPSGPLPPSGDAQLFGYDPVSNNLIVQGISPGGGTNATWLLSDANAIGGNSVWSNVVPENSPGTPPEGFAALGNAYNSQKNEFILALNRRDSLGNVISEVWVLNIPDLRPVPSSSLGPPSPNINPQAVVAEPVSTGNGNYFYQHADFVVPGRGLPLAFTRTYNARDNSTGPLGANWTHSYNIVLSKASDGGVTIRWGDGHSETFTVSGGTYTVQLGVFSSLTANPDGTFVLAKKDQSQYRFSSAGKLIGIQDRNLNTVTLTYDDVGNLTAITDAEGRSLVLIYDASNRIIQVIDPIGRIVSFTYSPANDLVSTIDPAGGVTSLTYDANHRVLSITQPTGVLLFSNTYDEIGRVISQTNGRGFTTAFAYDTPSPGSTTITDARGNKTVHTYDALPRIVKIVNAASGPTSFAYDSDNNRTSITNQNSNTTIFSYDAQGNITGINDPLANSASFTYDSRNNLLTATNGKGKTTSFAYDNRSNLTSLQDALGNTTAFTYDRTGQLTSKKDAVGNTTAYSHDSFGNLTSVANALGNSTTFSYDSIGRLTAVTDPNGHTAFASYDALSRLVAVTDPLTHRTVFSYDPVGNLLAITDANGNATNYAYDAANNLVAVTDALGHITKYSYDENNNRTAFINAKGNATFNTYDPLNRLSAVTDPLTFATVYTYDALGNVIAVRDANGNTNRFAYDALNRLSTVSYGDGATVAYSYDANGNRTAMTDTHGTTIYSYDALNRLTSVVNPDGKTIKYQYNAVGNRQSLTYPDGKVVTYTYDPVNRLSQVQDWLGRTTNYHYDPAGSLISLTYPNQAGISFAHDSANRLTGVTNSFLKPGGMEDGVSHHFGVFQYLLDAVGNRLQVSNGRGKIIRYSYDKLYELTGVSPEPSGDDNDDQDDDGLVATYAYDAVGNRVRASSSFGTVSYSYDAADRLLQAGTASYTYDANGNQTSVTKTATSNPIVYRYDAANRLISVTGGAVNSSFSYDGDGNRISQSVGLVTFSYVNDIASTLPVVLQESGLGGDISYAYGLSLISESDNGFDNFYQYDGLGSVVGLTNLQGRLIQRYTYDAWGQALRSIPASQAISELNKFRFTGEALDPGTEIYYLRARYYSPALGRFISSDPIQATPFAPGIIAKYSYAANNPLRLVDPNGLSPQERSIPNQGNLTANLFQVFGSLAEQTAETVLDIYGQAKLGLEGLGSSVSALTGFWKVQQATGLLDQVSRMDRLYESRPDLRDKIDMSIFLGKKWPELTPQQKQEELPHILINLKGSVSKDILDQALQQGIVF